MIQTIVTGIAISQLKNLAQFESQSLVTVNNIVQALCFDYHPTQVGKRALRLEQLNFHDVQEAMLAIILNQIKVRLQQIDTADQKRESYFAVRQDITMTVTTLKKYIYFSSALNKAKAQGETSDEKSPADEKHADEEYWRAQNPVVLDLYEKLQRLVLQRWNMLTFTQRVQLMFEFNQKGIMAPWFMNDSKVQDHMEGVDCSTLAERNTIDFINFGHTIASKQISRYSKKPKMILS